MIDFDFARLGIITAVPFVLLAANQHRWAILWLGATIGTEILDADVGVSITPLNAFGLIYLPSAVVLLPRILKTRIGVLLMISFGFLVFLGLVFGYLFPWPDLTGVRPLSQQAPGRSVIFSVRTATELSAGVYIARRAMLNSQSISWLFSALLVGTTLASLGSILQYVTDVDIYSLVTRTEAISYDRVRGLNGEPRTAGQLAALGILLIMQMRLSRQKAILLSSLHGSALMLTVARTGAIVLVAGLVTMALLGSKGRLRAAIALAALALTVLGAQSAFPSLSTQWQDRVLRYLEESAVRPQDTAEEIAFKLEVFDASAFLFLWHHPKYLITGVGPGLISLPASAYIPYGIAQQIYGDRIDSVPHMGLLLTVANSGIVGLILLVLLMYEGYRAINNRLTRLVEEDEHERFWWNAAATMIVVVSVLYLLQAKPIFFLFLGIGLGAAMSVNPTKAKSLGTVSSVAPTSSVARRVGAYSGN